MIALPNDTEKNQVILRKTKFLIVKMKIQTLCLKVVNFTFKRVFRFEAFCLTLLYYLLCH